MVVFLAAVLGACLIFGAITGKLDWFDLFGLERSGSGFGRRPCFRHMPDW
jgi:hypothetical protein